MEIRVDQDTSFVLWAFALTGSVGLLPAVNVHAFLDLLVGIVMRIRAYLLLRMRAFFHAYQSVVHRSFRVTCDVGKTCDIEQDTSFVL